MKLSIMPVAAAVLAVGCSGDAPQGTVGGDAVLANETAAIGADRDWLGALAQNDADAGGALLAEEFQWIDTEGRLRARTEAIDDIAALGSSLAGESGAQSYHYGHVEVITSERPGERWMRVWTLEPEGWRAFAVIGTALVTGSTPFAASGNVAAGDCENPCRSMPFTPTTENEKTIADLFIQLKLDEWQPNPERWAPYVLDDVYYTTATAQLSKAARVEHLTALREAGARSAPGDPVASMRIFDFGDSAVMLARHDPYRGGQPYLSVRVWAFRDGRWQLANTQQTIIADAPAAAPVAGARPL
jgi:hypothetical protein